MPISIISEPAQVFKRWTLSKNPFIVKVACSDYVSSAGAKWSRRYTVTTVPGIGDTLQLDSTAMGVNSFVFVDAEPGNDAQIRVPGTGIFVNTSEWMDEYLIPGLLNNELFSQYYTARRAGTFLEIEAVEYEGGYEITHSTGGAFVLTTVLTVDYVPLSINTDKKVCMRVNVNDAFNVGQYTRSKLFVYDPILDNDTGMVEVDLSEHIDSMIDGDPLPITSFPHRPNKLVRKVFVDIGVYDVPTGSITGKKITKTISVLKGGMSIKDFDDGYVGFTATSGYSTGGKFITNRPKVVYTHKSAIDFLSFHIFNEGWPAETGSDFRVKARVYYINGTSVDNDLFIIPATTTTYEGTQVVTVPAGFDMNNLASYSALDKPYKYEIFIPNFNDCVQTFYLVEDTDIGFSLCYINEYGVPEGVWCEGERVMEVGHQREIVETSRGIRKTWKNELMEVSNSRSIVPTISATTAPMLSKEWRGNLGMLLSEKVWIYFDPEKPIPAQIVPGSVQDETVNWEGNHALAMRFTLRMNAEIGWSDMNNTLK